MLSSNDIKNVKLAKAAVGGYKTEEVDLLLNKIVADYEEYESRIKKFQTKLEEAKGTVEQFKKEKGSINNVLVSAQQLADNIVADANKKAEEIVAEANAKADEINAASVTLREELAAGDAAERERLEKEMAVFVKENELKKEAMLAAAKEAVQREQSLFDKLRIEVAQFKAKALAFYEDGISVVKGMPEAVPMDAEAAAKAAALAVDEIIDAEKIAKDVAGVNEAKEQEVVEQTEDQVKETVTAEEEAKVDKEDKQEEKNDNVKPAKRSFFAKKNDSEG